MRIFKRQDKKSGRAVAGDISRSGYRYISLFSGVGGLESSTREPVLCCEIDKSCWGVLKRRFPSLAISDDVLSLVPPKVDVVAGGWPCQDISVAGKRVGLAGKRSGLFYQMVCIAKAAEAHTIVAENVPHLLHLNQGRAFREVVSTLVENGFEYVSWRLLNAREFGLPHQRERVFIIASKHEPIARALHRPIQTSPPRPRKNKTCAGFYWTAGLQSICYNEGFVPTLKVGSSLMIPSPPALHFGNTVRKATAVECLELQGFDPDDFCETPTKDVFRMAGNAVAVPVGRFAMDSVEWTGSVAEMVSSDFFHEEVTDSGFYSKGRYFQVPIVRAPFAANLADFVDMKDTSSLSPRAAGGLLKRLEQSGKICPKNLLSLLRGLAAQREDIAREPAACYRNNEDRATMVREGEFELLYTRPAAK